ncbi:hypothetical protein G7Y89_g10461 [Cudoniella acicularis]|uniref:Major facilitator superfamily (MFS) profile domain-containing protein n=1 Tax=Cudoniella acicularis TaxID=354080 RepID=A0A8H4REA0_9HELO|nr:hypothetical protein G7Y89_g10461 [Cudoniella acicularis]
MFPFFSRRARTGPATPATPTSTTSSKRVAARNAQAAAEEGTLNSYEMDSSDSNSSSRRYSDESLPPGTVRLEDAGVSAGRGNGHLILQPHPSEDPNDPLNWSKKRKFVNFAIICYYSLMIFVILDIGGVAWQNYIDELDMTDDELNITYAVNCAGLAVGCIFFIPFSLKYGRRPVYIVSTVITFAMSIWQAALHSYGEMVATQLISGLSGAVSETLVQLTVIDMFFVHQRATMNGIYLMMVAIGGLSLPD